MYDLVPFTLASSAEGSSTDAIFDHRHNDTLLRVPLGGDLSGEAVFALNQALAHRKPRRSTPEKLAPKGEAGEARIGFGSLPICADCEL